MGNNISSNNISDLSSEDIGNDISNIGKEYEPYKASIISNAIDGSILSSLSISSILL
jgi:hypothetical protein